ncbi:MAG TPA: NrfD/PsrC family molybdoenzyme membrane anchor subunit [Thermoanaerobaculia bacterium]|nr:NrfD/PsrC family molybdoenzyme membrane anchor subunit [Thermoanaerobaculia bacterium]
MTEIESFRHNPLIDPTLHIWGWEIAVYLFLGGLTAGIMIVSALIGKRVPAEAQSRWMRWMPFAAPLLLSVGMLALFLDLEQKVHVFRFYTAFRLTSPMSWGSWILLLIYPASLLFGLARLTDQELACIPFVRRSLIALAAWAKTNIRQLERANVILGVALGAYTGVLLGTLGARAAWSSVVLAPLFLASGISTGAALVMLFPISESEHQQLRNWDMAVIALESLLLALFFVDLVADGGKRGHSAAGLFLGGAYTATFWSFVVIAGLALPLLVELLESRRPARASILAPALLLLGGFALRWILTAAGQAAI